MKFQNFRISSFQITTVSISCLKYSTTASYFHFFIVCVLVPYAFQFTYGYIMVRFLINTTFWGTALIRGRSLLEDGVYYDLSVNGAALIKRRRLFEIRHLLEEIRYQKCSSISGSHLPC